MKSIKVRLELNNKQQTLAKKHAGTARFAYNWGITKSQELMEQGGKRPSGRDLHKLWVAEVKPNNLITTLKASKVKILFVKKRLYQFR